jgi:chromosome segregation ATPase
MPVIASPPKAKPRGPAPSSAQGKPRASSHQSARKDSATPAKRSVSSTGGKRVVAASSALVPLAEEVTEATELRQANLQLRAELLDLNRRLDEVLHQKGQKVSRVHAVPKGAAMLPSDRVAAKNEQQRKMNAELCEQIQRPHVQHRMSDAANALGHAKHLLEEATSEMTGLENVLVHQRHKLDRIDLIEREMGDARSQHAENQHLLKDRTRTLKETREKDMAEYNKLIRLVERMEEKIKVQDEVGAAVKSVELVKEQVEESDRMIDALKYQVAVLSRTNVGDQKKARAVNDRLSKELHSLREEAESLRKQVKALGLVAELAVDTRM